MRHHHERAAASRALPEQQVDDARPRVFVEISGRFVREQDRGIADERAGKRHALLLAAR